MSCSKEVEEIPQVKIQHSKGFLSIEPISSSVDGRPLCYVPEENNPYPLCIGNGGPACSKCCFYADMDMEDYFER